MAIIEDWDEDRTELDAALVRLDKVAQKKKDMMATTEKLAQHYEIDLLKEIVLWARENGVVLGEVHVGSCGACMNDPRVNVPVIPQPGEHDDAVDRESSSPPANFYEQYARSSTPGKKHE